MPKMNDDQLRAVLDHEIQQSVSWHVSTVRGEQERNLAYYLGLPLGNEVEGRSQVVSWDVFEIIESALPSFVEPFFSGDHIGEFQPRGVEDEAYAQQATDLVNYVVKDQNPGFLIFSTWIKDALLSKIGVVRADWVAAEPKREEFAGLTDEQIMLLIEDPACQIIEHGMQPQPDGSALHDVTVLKKQPGRVVIENVKPEVFIVSKGAASVDKAALVGEIVTYTRSDLKEMGFKQATEVNSYDGAVVLADEMDHIRDEGASLLLEGNSVDKALEEVRLFRGFIRCDYDGDGVAEYRRVLVGGNLILENEEADGHHYCVLTPIPVPHRVIGLAYADPAAEIQRLKTSLMRQYLDSLYLANNPKTYVNQDAGVRLDDLLSNRIGGIVRGRGPAQNAIQPLQTTMVAQESLQGLEFADTLREARLGVTRYNQGLDADSLNKTATGIRQIGAAGDKRQAMTLRIFAETGVRDLFRLVLRLVTQYQDAATTIRLRGEWVQYDPRGWNPDMDCTIAVGIGSGDKTETLMMLQQFGAFMAQAAQVGVVQPQNVYEFGKMLAKNAKLRGADEKLLTDPSKQPPKQPPPDPAMVKAQIEAQARQQEIAMRQRENDMEFAHKQRMADMDERLKQFDLLIAQQKLQQQETALALKARDIELNGAARAMQASDDMARAQQIRSDDDR